jgi:hypothetical protein
VQILDGKCTFFGVKGEERKGKGKRKAKGERQKVNYRSKRHSDFQTFYRSPFTFNPLKPWFFRKHKAKSKLTFGFTI